MEQWFLRITAYAERLFDDLERIDWSSLTKEAQRRWITFEPDGTPRPASFPDDAYNFQPANYLQIPHTRYSAGLFGTWEMNNGYEWYVEASYARTLEILDRCLTGLPPHHFPHEGFAPARFVAIRLPAYLEPALVLGHLRRGPRYHPTGGIGNRGRRREGTGRSP